MKFTFFLLLSLLILGSCNEKGKKNGSPNVSPFEKEKVLVSRSLLKMMGADAKDADPANLDLPDGVTFGFIINDQCVLSRLKSPGFVQYFVDKYVDVKAIESKQGDAAILPESIVSIGLKKGSTLADLKYLVKIDRCIVGVSDLKNQKVDSNQFEDPFYREQVASYYKRNGFEEAEAFFRQNIPSTVKVNVAVIDSGYDLAQGDIRSITKNIEGLDVAEKDDLPQDTLGHGTEVANVIAAEANAKGGVGIASRNAILIPVRAFKTDTIEVNDAYIFDAIKRAVNAGAEVINMSFSGILDREGIIHNENLKGEDYFYERQKDKELICSPIIGHAIFRSIQRKVFISMSAGHATSFEKDENGKWKRYRIVGDQYVACNPGELGCIHKKPIPGSLHVPRENGGEFFGNNALPACWSRHYEGAMSVAALDVTDDALASFSNWGSDGPFKNDGVEIAAPGVNIVVESLSGRKVVTKGTSFSAPQVAAAAGLIKAFYKHQANLSGVQGKSAEWSISPWNIESIILASAKEVPLLNKAGGKNVRNGKVLSFTGIAGYLSKLASLDYAQRRILASINDNTEVGAGFRGSLGNDPRRASEVNGAKIIGIDLYSRLNIIHNRDQTQLQLVAYYDNGASDVITDKGKFVITTGKGAIANGILFPDPDFEGVIAIEGSYGGFKTSYRITSTKDSVISGIADLIPEKLELKLSANCCYTTGPASPDYDSGTRVGAQVIAVYVDSSRRDVTGHASLSAVSKGKSLNGLSTAFLFGGDTVTVTAHYLGVKATADILLPKTNVLAQELSLGFEGVDKNLPDLPLDDKIDYTFYEKSDHRTTVVDYKQHQSVFLAAKKTTDKDWTYEIRTRDLPPGIHHYDYYTFLRSSGQLQRFEGRVTIEIKPDKITDFEVGYYDYRSPNSFRAFDNKYEIYNLTYATLYLRHITENKQFLPARDYTFELFREAEKFSSGKSSGKDADAYFPLYVYTHAPNVTHFANFTSAITGKTVRIPFTYPANTHRVEGMKKFYRDPETFLRSEFQKLGWNLKTELRNGKSVFTIDNPKTTSAACQRPQNPFPAGTGLVNDPFILCKHSQLLELYSKFVPELRSNSPNLQKYSVKVGDEFRIQFHVQLGDHIDLARHQDLIKNLEDGYYKQVTSYLVINGAGFSFRNFKHLDTEEKFDGIFGDYYCPKLSNIGFESMTVNASDAQLLCNSSSYGFKNVYIKDASVSAYGESSSDGSGRLMTELRDGENVLMQAEFYGSKSVGPIQSTFHLKNFIFSVHLASIPGSSFFPQFYGVTMRAPSLPAAATCLFNQLPEVTEKCLEEKTYLLNGIVKVSSKVGPGKIYSLAGVSAETVGVIGNVHVSGRLESTGDMVGGITSQLKGHPYGNGLGYILDSSFKGEIYGTDHLGGIIGVGSLGTIQGCTVQGIVSGQVNVGGLVGSQELFLTAHDNDTLDVKAFAEKRNASLMIGAKVLDINWKKYVPDILDGNRFGGLAIGNDGDVPASGKPVTSIKE